MIDDTSQHDAGDRTPGPDATNDCLTFRFYRPDDWAGVRQLFDDDGARSGGRAAPDDETHDFPFGEGVDVGWVAEAGGRVVGVVVARERSGHVAYISHLKEHAQFQGRDVAARLASIALRHAMEQQCLKIVLYSVAHAAVADDFERAGLRPAGGHGRPGHRHLDFYLDLYRRLDRGGQPVDPSSLSPSPPPRPRG